MIFVLLFYPTFTSFLAVVIRNYEFALSCEKEVGINHIKSKFCNFTYIRVKNRSTSGQNGSLKINSQTILLRSISYKSLQNDSPRMLVPWTEFDTINSTALLLLRDLK